ncbi:ArsR/SmtB family transcription factor [Streptomyces boninensis]|uniref:ArsR/SmtB family transcription factor n=1 Tax=Streptomyces boninensis TaxID=2039455 RepID=UPI003B228648
MPKVIPDLAALKCLAHPRRQLVLQQLTLHGPATSASLARALDLNTGATSYHLRELARHGFVTDEPGRGRERWWRAAGGDLRFPRRSEQSDETRAVLDSVNRHAFAADLELFERAQRQAHGEWRDAFPYSRGTIRLTAGELNEFFEDFIALLDRYKRPEAETPAGARTVRTQLLAFPAPDSEDDDS